MATPRKHWFRVADSIGVEPWSNDVLATLIRLQATLNTRWARDGKTGAEAARVRLRNADVLAMCGKGRLDVALTLLARCADVASISVRRDGDVTEIEWPKFAEFQRYESEPGEIAAPELPPPRRPRPRKTQDAEEATRKPARAKQLRLTHPPAPPKEEDPRWSEMAGWLAYHYPDRVLPLDRVEKLRAARPGGVLYGIGAVHCWYVATAPKISERGYSDLWKTAQNWWKRVTQHEIDVAYRYCEQLATERFAIDHPPREPDPVDPEAYRLVYSAITARSVGGVK